MGAAVHSGLLRGYTPATIHSIYIREAFLFPVPFGAPSLLNCSSNGVSHPFVGRVGANRIVLFDSDWNPATDDQVSQK